MLAAMKGETLGDGCAVMVASGDPGDERASSRASSSRCAAFFSFLLRHPADCNWTRSAAWSRP